MLYIGVDLGTSAVKLLLMNSEGHIEKIASREYALSFPHPGWSEQNPYDWYDQSMDGLKELLSECGKSHVYWYVNGHDKRRYDPGCIGGRFVWTS